jgi:hypothetical protein
VGLPLILAVAIAAVLLSGGGEGTQPTKQGQAPRPAEEQPHGGERGEASRGGGGLGHPALGRAAAPVLMVEYGDFQ